MPARRRAEHADPIGADAELAARERGRAHGAQHILQAAQDGRIPTSRYFSAKTATPARVSMRRDARHFVRHRQPRIAAAGTHDHRGAVGGALRRRIVRSASASCTLLTRPSTTVRSAAVRLDGAPGTPSGHSAISAAGTFSNCGDDSTARRDANGVNAALEPRDAVLTNADRRSPAPQRQERDRAGALLDAVHVVPHRRAVERRSPPRASLPTRACAPDRAASAAPDRGAGRYRAPIGRRSAAARSSARFSAPASWM